MRREFPHASGAFCPGFDIEPADDAVTVDEELPFELGERLRVALVTADRAAATALRCAQAGIPILSKPLDPERLFGWLAGDGRIAAE